MTFLLDVNALLALGFHEHEFHERVARWLTSLSENDRLATCPITELGFVRILARVSDYGVTVEQARTLLARLKASRVRRFIFVADDHGAEHLPRWVKHARQTTDGHLAELAGAQQARLATLDEGIPGAFVVPSISRRSR